MVQIGINRTKEKKFIIKTNHKREKRAQQCIKNPTHPLPPSCYLLPRVAHARYLRPVTPRSVCLRPQTPVRKFQRIYYNMDNIAPYFKKFIPKSE